MTDDIATAATDEKMLCYVIGPIGEEASVERIHADWFFHVIGLAFADFPEFRVDRADKSAKPGMITTQIIKALHTAKLVIADLSFHNANAFYELGIRHLVRKPVIHMIRRGERIPFDVMPHQAIHFSYATPSDMLSMTASIRAAVTEAIKADFEPDNPITHALGILNIDQKGSGPEKAILQRLSDLEARLNADDSSRPRRRVRLSSSVYSGQIAERPGVTYLLEFQNEFDAARAVLDGILPAWGLEMSAKGDYSYELTIPVERAVEIRRQLNARRMAFKLDEI